MRALILVASAALAVAACTNNAEGDLTPTDNNTVTVNEPDAVDNTADTTDNLDCGADVRNHVACN
jgi:hypothetical protein